MARPKRTSGKLISTPRASRTSAEPQRELADRLPCLATRAPAAEATMAAAVEILKVPLSSPPVPQVSTMFSGFCSVGENTGAACLRMTVANPDNSAEVTRRKLSDSSKRTIAGVSTRPESSSSMRDSAARRSSAEPASILAIRELAVVITFFCRKMLSPCSISGSQVNFIALRSSNSNTCALQYRRTGAPDLSRSGPRRQNPK